MRPDERVVSADRHARELERPFVANAFERIGQCRVAPKDDLLPIPRDNIAVIPAMRIPPPPRAPVLHLKSSDFSITIRRIHHCLFTPTELRHLFDARLSNEIRRIPRRHRMSRTL